MRRKAKLTTSQVNNGSSGMLCTYKSSLPTRVSDVKARYVPSSPSIFGRKKLAPTSGKYPILVSGIANIVFSVAILKGAPMERPTPPPTDVKVDTRGQITVNLITYW